jgi:phosphoglycolate phosphatase
MLTTLFLFDIDGTLIGGSKAGQVSYVKAIKSCFNIEVDISNYSTAGKTDLLILEELLRINDIETGEIDKKKLVASYLSHLEASVRLDPGIVLPGVKDLLNKLTALDNIFLGLGTGNLERVARIKLRIHRLDSYFRTGGFGSDATQREDIISVGSNKSEKYFGINFMRVIVVGDTPFDIAASKMNGVHCIAVATGPYNMEDLRKAGATQILPNLAQDKTFMEILDLLPPTANLYRHNS